MGRLRRRNGKSAAGPLQASKGKKKAGTAGAEVNPATGEKIPKSFVFARGKLPCSLRHLQHDLRKLMLPYTALRLKEKKRNSLKDFLNVAGPMGVTHFFILSKPKSVPHLRVARTTQGPTLTFQVLEYALAADVARAQLRPRCPQDMFRNSPLIVLSGFGSGGQQLKLVSTMFQNIFPVIDINTVKLVQCRRIVLLSYNPEEKLIDFRHYSIRLQPVGVTHRIRKLVQSHKVPNLNGLKDVSDFMRAGYGSESEAEEESVMVSLASDVDKINRASSKSAVKLQEIGPRMTLRLVKIEEGLCSGDIIFSKSRRGKEDEEDDGDDHDNDQQPSSEW